MRRFLSILGAVLFGYLLLEVGSYLAMKNNILHGDWPLFSWKRVGTHFFHDIPEPWATWHEPNSSYRHVSPCFDVTYHFNEEGMRDRPRSRRSSAPRTVVLGDSFVEGWGVEQGERMTNLLEAATGREFLNFGSSGSFGPMQYYLIYENFAKRFDHDSVLVGILPANDFDDDNIELWEGEGRRRPFWVGEPPVLTYTQAQKFWWQPIRRVLHEFSFFYNAADTLYQGWKVARQKKKTHIQSRFYDFTEAEWRRMEYSLQKLRDSSRGKKLTLVLFPLSKFDFQRFLAEGKSPLVVKLEAWAKDQDVTVIDLTPWLGTYQKDSINFSLACDNHWSAKGHRAAFEFVRKYFAPGDGDLGLGKNGAASP